MAAHSRLWVETLSVYLAAAVAGLVVTVPIDFRWVASGSPVELQMLVSTVPSLTAASALTAVIVAVLCSAAGVRLVWSVACACAVLLLCSHLVAHGLTSALSTFAFVDAVVSGALLGAAAALPSGRRPVTGGLLAGAVTGIVIGNRMTVPLDDEQLRSVWSWALIDPPSVLLLVVASGLLGWCVWCHRGVGPIPDREVPLRPVLAMLVLVSSSLIRTEWVAGQADWLLRIVLGCALAVLSTLIAALVLPHRDGVLVAIAVTFAVAAGAVGVGPRPGWTVPVLAVAVVVGLRIGTRRPRPAAAVAASVALAVFAAVTGASGSAVVPAVGGVAIALIGGYSFGIVVPEELSTTVLALTMLLAPSIIVAVVSRRFGHVDQSDVWFRSTPTAYLTPGWTAVAVTISCGAVALAVHRLRPSRPAAEPEPPRPIPRIVSASV